MSRGSKNVDFLNACSLGAKSFKHKSFTNVTCNGVCIISTLVQDLQQVAWLESKIMKRWRVQFQKDYWLEVFNRFCCSSQEQYFRTFYITFNQSNCFYRVLPNPMIKRFKLYATPYRFLRIPLSQRR